MRDHPSPQSNSFTSKLLIKLSASLAARKTSLTNFSRSWQSACAGVLVAVLGIVGGVLAPASHASLIAVLGDGNNANDVDGLAYLNNVLGVSGLTLLAKEDIGGGFTGAIEEADWTLTDTGRTGTWTIDDNTVVPTYFFNKFDGLLAIYSVMDADGMNPWTDSYNLDDIWVSATNTLLVPIVDQNNNVLYATGTYPGFPPPNPGADTSHVSVYGSEDGGGGPPQEIPVPEPSILALFGIGLAGMGVVRLRRCNPGNN